MKIRKSFAGVAAGSLALAGLAVATAPTANAFSGNLSLGCWVDGISTSVAAWPNTTNPAQNATIAHSLSVNGLTGGTITANAGTTANIVYSYSQGPINGGPTATAVSSVDFKVYTAGVDNVFGTNDDVETATVVNSPDTFTDAVNGGSTAAFPGHTYTGSFVVPGNGSYQVKVKNVNWFVSAFALNINCNGNTFGTSQATGPSTIKVGYAGTSFTALGPNASVTTITGQRAGVTGYARATDVLNVTGTVWGASVASGGFTATVGGASATNTLSTDASGVLSGTITVPAGATTGLTSIALTQGANSSSTPITILGTRTISLSPANAGPGTAIAVSGTNWDPNAAVGIQGYLSLVPFPSVSSDAAVNITSSASGNISGSFTVNDSGTTAIGAAETPPFGSPAVDNATAPFAVNAFTCTRQVGSNTPTTCNTKQNISATVLAGALTQTASAFGAGYTSTSIPFGSITSAVTAGTLTANLNPIVVADARGGASGWSLTAAMPALSDGAGGSIANSNLSTTSLSCASNATGSATGNVAGAATQTFAGTVTLCTKSTVADSAGGTSGGSYLVNAGLSLNIPAFQKASAYTSTITVTLT